MIPGEPPDSTTAALLSWCGGGTTNLTYLGMGLRIGCDARCAGAGLLLSCVCLVCGLVVVEPLFKFFKELCASSLFERTGAASSWLAVPPGFADGCVPLYSIHVSTIVPCYFKLSEIHKGI